MDKQVNEWLELIDRENNTCIFVTLEGVQCFMTDMYSL
jgi:hypothetical protein